MGSGAMRKLGVPSAALAAPAPVSAKDAPLDCGAHPAKEAPATAAVARPPSLNRLRRLSEPVVEVAACVLVILFMGTLLCVLFPFRRIRVPLFVSLAVLGGFAGPHYARLAESAHLPRSIFAVSLCKQAP